MSTYAVTGASGPFGHAVVEALINKGIAAADIVAVARTPHKVAELRSRGVRLRQADYELPETLDAALTGVDVLLLVSGSEVGRRVVQHGNVIAAARRAQVGHIAYTSVLRADSTPLVLAPEHKATEQLLIESGLPYTLLRNGWYFENYLSQLDGYLERGEILHAGGTGRISAATRADFAEAAAAALLEERPDNAVHELGGAPFTYAGLAAAVAEASGRQVVATEVSGADLVVALTGVGLDEGTANFLAALDANIAEGALDNDSDDLAQLLGREPTPLVDAVRAAL